MDLQKEKHEYLTMLVEHGAITQEQSDSLGLFNNNIGLHSNSITSSLIDCINWGWQSWLKAKAIPEGFVLVPKEPYAYLIKHKFWQKGSDPEIFLAEEFLGDYGVEKDKLTVCIPLYLGDDEAQEQAK